MRPLSPSGQTPQQDHVGVDAARHPATLVTDDRVAGVKSEMGYDHAGNKVQITDDQLEHVNRSSSVQPLFHTLRFRPIHSFATAFSIRQ